MRSPVAVLALALLILTVASPAIEAVAGCLTSCPEEAPGPGPCSSDTCCSCCVHAGPLFASLSLPAHTLDRAGLGTPPEAPPVPLDRSSDILHVPKPSAA
jgi:hypothetical protein